MYFAGYRSDALGAAVDLVNAVTADAPDASEGPDLAGLLDFHGYTVDETGIDEPLRAWARRLRTVFDASGPVACAAAVNALLADVELAPHLSDHAGNGWHLHYSPPEAPVLDRVRTTTAFALALLVAEHGTDRHGHCAAVGCRRVFADTTRNAARRFCSPACANRYAVAAHRARRSVRPPGP